MISPTSDGHGPFAELLADAAAYGLVSRRDLASGRARVVDRRGLAAYAVVIGGREVGSVHWAASGVAGERERTVLRIAADAGLAATPLPSTGTAVWTRTAPTVALDSLVSRLGMPDLAAICAAWGAALARLHAIPTRGAVGLAAPLPAVLAGGSAWTVGDRAVTRLLSSAADRWEERAWIHGRPDLGTTALTSGGGVTLTDWSGAGVGDPGWDLAGACVATTVLAERHRVSAEALESYLLVGYRGHQGPGRLDPGFRVAQLVAAGRIEAARRAAARTVPVGLAA